MKHNVRMVAGSVCLALAITACSPNKTADEYYADAKAFQQQNDVKSALISLKSANAENPKNALLRYELGSLYLSQGDYLNAEKEIERAKELGFSEEKLLPSLVETKFKLSKYDEVYTIAEAGQALSDESYIQVLTYAGLSSLYDGKREQAKNYIDSANQISSESAYGLIGKAYLSQTAEEAKAALTNIDILVKSAPEMADAYLLKAYLLQGSNQFLEAAEAFEAYLKLRPKEYTVQFFIAQNYIQANELNKAAVIVNKLLKLSEAHPFANQMKAQIEFDKKNYELAQQHALIAYQGNNKLHASVILAGVSAYYSKKYEQAYGHLIKAESYVPDTHFVKQLIAELQLRLGYEGEAIKTLNTLIESGNADSSLLIAASQELINSGDNLAAQDMLQASIELGGEDPDLLRKQGLIKLRLNDVASSIEFLEKSIALAPDSSQTEASLAAAYASNNQFDKALAIAKSWQGKEDKKVQGLLFEASINQKQNNHEKAKSLLESILEIEADNGVAKYKLATYAHKENEIEKAFVYYKDVIIINSLHSGAMKGLLALVNKNEDYQNKTEQFYLSEIENKPTENTLKLGLSYLYNIQKRYQDSLDLLDAIKNSPSPIKGIELIIGDTYLIKRDLNKAVNNYKQVLLINPEHFIANTKLITLFESQNNIIAALDQVDKAIKYHPNNIGLKLFKANFMARLKQKPSDSLLSELRANKVVVEHWLYFSTLGHLALAEKDGNTAAQFYNKAYEIKPSAYNIIQLSTALGRAGDIKGAIFNLKEHLNKAEQSVSVQAMLANAYLQDNNTAMAELVYIDIIKSSADNVIALNNLAYINIQQGDIKDALVYAKRAVKIAPKNPAIIDTYGQSLLVNGMTEQALNAFESAVSIVPSNIEFNVNKAKALNDLGNKNQAQKLLNGLTPETPLEKKLISDALILIK